MFGNIDIPDRGFMPLDKDRGIFEISLFLEKPVFS
jgi:hypothetical protein